MKLTKREVELIRGMIEVQEDHTERCERLSNKIMADKQIGWNQERIDLLTRILNEAEKPTSKGDQDTNQ